MVVCCSELDFNDNASRADQWDSRQSSPPPPGDQGSNYSWSRKMSAEGDRQPMQTESQSAYANKQSRDVESPGGLCKCQQKSVIMVKVEMERHMSNCPVPA